MLAKIIPERVLVVTRALNASQHMTGIMGESAADLLKGVVPHKIELVTTATPEEISNIFPSTITETKNPGVITIPMGTEDIIVNCCKSQAIYEKEANPIEVELTHALAEEIARHPFTIDSLFLNPLSGQVLDHLEAMKDVNLSKLKPIGDPYKKIRSDRVCMLRACRYVAERDFEIDPDLQTAIKTIAPEIVRMSPSRIRDEIFRICQAAFPDKGFQAMIDLGLMAYVLPEVYNLVGCKQDPKDHKEEDLWVHTKGVLKTLADEDASTPLMLAGLLHDIGTPSVMFNEKEADHRKISTQGHAIRGANMATRICERLRIAPEVSARIREIVKQHEKAHLVKQIGPNQLDRWVEEWDLLGASEDIMVLQYADSKMRNDVEDNYEFFMESLARLEAMGKRHNRKHKSNRSNQQQDKRCEVIHVKPEPTPTPVVIPQYILDAVKEAQEEGLITA